MPTTSLLLHTEAVLQQGMGVFDEQVSIEYAHSLLTSLNATLLQSGTDCILPALGFTDTLIYLFVFVSPALTVFFFGLTRISDYVMSHTRLLYYLMTASSVLLRVSVVLGIIGVCMYLFVGFLAPDSFQACSQFGA
jgi:hypothetical protein